MRYLQLIRNTLREFSEDDCTTRAAAVAYSAFFSIFPLLLGLVALSGVFVDDPGVRERILGSAVSYLPGSADFVQDTIQDVADQRGGVGIVSVLLLIFSGRGVFQAIVHALSVAFETPSERGFVKSTLLAVGLIFGVGGLMVLSLVVTAVAQALAKIAVLGIGPFEESFIFTAVQTLITVAVNVAMFALLYKISPNMRVEWRDVMPGAVLAAVLFEALKIGFVVYLNRFTDFAAVYGTIGTVIALLTWCYFSSLVLLLGAELASENLKLRRQRIREPTLPRPAPAISLPARTPTARRALALASASAAFLVSVLAASRRRRPSY